MRLAAVACLMLLLGAAAPARTEVFRIFPDRQSHEYGTATFIERGDTTEVQLRLHSVTQRRQLAHIHDGRCGEFVPVPRWALSDLHDGVSTTVLRVPARTIFNAPRIIEIHDASNIAHFTACGRLRTQR
jgi:hypothetical protein